MFFCEECKQRNNWPGIWAFSYGNCEVCGTRASCYDVPSKHLPIPKPKVEKKSKKNRASELVHREHCCQKHGCKYYGAVGGPGSCPVMLDGGQFYMCQFCSEEIYEEGGWEDAHLLNEMFDKGMSAVWQSIQETLMRKMDNERK